VFADVFGVVCFSALFCSGVGRFVQGRAPMGFDFDEEGVGSYRYSFL
jgi:hypothetical protein